MSRVMSDWNSFLATSFAMAIAGTLWLGSSVVSGWRKRRVGVRVEVLSTRVVKPDIVDEVREKLSAWDERMALYDSAIHIVMRFENSLDPEVCFQGFVKAVSAQPLLASRYHRASGELVVNPSSCGAVFQVAACTYEKETSLPNDTFPSAAWRSAGLTALTPEGMLGSEFQSSDALVRARITVCPKSDVSYLALCVSHILCDGQNVVELLHSWARLSSEKSVVAAPLASGVPKARWIKGNQAIGDEIKLGDWWETFRTTGRPIGWGFRVRSYLVTLPQIFAGLVLNRANEWVVSTSALAALKGQVCKQLPPGEWVSSYEVLFSALICAHERAQGREKSRFAVTAVVNMRGRHADLDKDYFGNASAPLDIGAVDVTATKENFLADVSRTASFIHNLLRNGLQDQSKMRSIHEWADAARDLGVKPMFYPEFCDGVAGRGSEINSWSSYPWLDLKFGDSGKPSCISVPYKYVPRGVWLQLPLNHRDSMLLLSLPKQIARKMVQHLELYQLVQPIS